MKHLEYCIDCESEYGKKYIALVSSDDNVKATQLHHIVPVAYFKDVLGVTECRKKGSPDMDPDNLVNLSVGKHLLAHYYLMKCAKKCIKAQMTNAFMCTYKTSSLEGITEDDVLSRMKEIDAEYALLKDGKRPHKDEITVSHGKNKHRLTRWFNGEKYGTYVVYDDKDRVQELGKYGSPIRIRFTYLDEYGYTTCDNIVSRNSAMTDYEPANIYVLWKNKYNSEVSIYAGNAFHVSEQAVHRNRLIHCFHDDDNGLSYHFRTQKACTNNTIKYDEIRRLKPWIQKLEFCEDTYEMLASIMDLIKRSKHLWPNMYSVVSKDSALEKIASRATNKCEDIYDMIDDFNEYVKNNIIPCESIPLAS